MEKTKQKKLIAARLDEDEIQYLKDLGLGDLTAGLRTAMKRAGYKKMFPPEEKGYRVVAGPLKLGSESGNRYTLYLNGEPQEPALTLTDSIYSALVKKYGKNFVMQDLIIGAFPELPKEAEIDRIYDTDGKVFWNKYQD